MAPGNGDWAGLLLSGGDCLVLPMVPARHERQVDGGYVDEQGHCEANDGDPESPVSMSAHPPGTGLLSVGRMRAFLMVRVRGSCIRHGFCNSSDTDQRFQPESGAPCLLFRCMRESKEWEPL